MHEIAVGTRIDVEHAGLRFQWYVEDRRCVGRRVHVIANDDVDLDVADLVFKGVVRCGFTQITCNRTGLDPEVRMQLVGAPLQLLAQDIDQDQVHALDGELAGECVAEAFRTRGTRYQRPSV